MSSKKKSPKETNVFWPKTVLEYQGVEFVHTEDKAQLEEFMQLRSDLYKNDPKFIGFREFTTNDIRDYVSKYHRTQLLMKNGKCIGGGRLSLKPKGSRQLLPLEIDLMDKSKDTEYSLSRLLPELDIEQHGCVEVNRMVVSPEYRGNTNIIGNMFLNFFVLGLEMEAEYLFAMTDKLRGRMYRQLARNSVFRDGVEFTLDLPDRTYFEGVKMYINGWDKYNNLGTIYTKN